MLKILPLEERIVLDATLVAAIAPTLNHQHIVHTDLSSVPETISPVAQPPINSHTASNAIPLPAATAASPPHIFVGSDPLINPTEGSPYPAGIIDTVTLNSSTATPVSGTVTWGDGTTDVVTFRQFATASYDVIAPAHTYLEEGTFSGNITVQDSANNTYINPLTANVADAPLTAQSAGIVALQAQPFSGLVASFTDADPNGTVADYTATINWGDGTTTAGTIVQGTEAFLVDGTHTYAQNGTDPILITITDTGGASVSFNTMATVDTFSTSPITFSANEGAFAAKNLATIFTNDTNAASLSVSIDWGDGTPRDSRHHCSRGR